MTKTTPTELLRQAREALAYLLPLAEMQPADVEPGRHLMRGDCPDETQPSSRDAECPACKKMVAAAELIAAIDALPSAPAWPCHCDERGIGKPGVTCGDCPRDYGHTVDSAPSGEPAPTRADLIAALTFYATCGHMNLSDESAWDTVTGEPQNWWCDEAGTATIEDGSLAKMALAGDMNAGHFAALERGDDVCIQSEADRATTAPAPLPPHKGLTVKVGADGVWLHFAASTGRSALLNVGRIANSHGSIVSKALLDWAADVSGAAPLTANGPETATTASVAGLAPLQSCEWTNCPTRVGDVCCNDRAAPAQAAPAPQAEPIGYMSPQQVPAIRDPQGDFGHYIPMRKTPAGSFTLALYTAAPAAPAAAAPKPASKEQIEQHLRTLTTDPAVLDVLRAIARPAPAVAEPTAVPQADAWRKLYRRAINEANGLTNYVEDRPELRRAERNLSAIEAEAQTLADTPAPKEQQ